MTAPFHRELVLPARFGQSDLADVVLNGASRGELLASQSSVAAAGTGLRLDHRVAISLIIDLRDSGWREQGHGIQEK